MRRRFLHFLGTFTFRYAWLVAPLLVVLTVWSAWVWASGFTVDTGLLSFLPPESEQQGRVREIVADYRKLEPVVVMVRAQDGVTDPNLKTALKTVTTRLAEVLNDQRYFYPPVYRVDELVDSYYQSLPDIRLMQLLTPADWTVLKEQLSARISEEWLRKKRGYRVNAFVPRGMQAGPMEDPLGALGAVRDRMALSRGPARLQPQDGFFFTTDGRAILLLLYPVRSPDDAGEADRTLAYLQESRDYVMEYYESWRDVVDIEFHGSLVETARVIETMRGDLRKILYFIVPLTVLILLLMFRKVEAVLFVLTPPALGLTWTVALATVINGGMSAVAIAFVLVVLAMGLHFSVHLYHRFTMELYRTKNYYRALKLSYVETARGILASAVTMAVIFFLLYLTSVWRADDWTRVFKVAEQASGFAEVGLIAGLCMLFNLAACLLVLPVLAAIKRLMARGRVKPVLMYDFGVERLYEIAIARPRTTLCVVLLGGVLCGIHSRDLTLHSHFVSISPLFYPTALEEASTPENDSNRDATTTTGLRDQLPGRPLVAIVQGATQQQALEANDQLYRNLQALDRKQFGVLAVDSLRPVLPSVASQRQSLEQLASLDLQPFETTIGKVSRDVGLKAEVYRPFVDALESFKARSEQPRYLEYSFDESDALISTAQRYLTVKRDDSEDLKTTYYVRTAIYPAAEGFNRQAIDTLEEKLSANLATLTLIGDPMVERQLEQSIKFNLAVLILVSIFTILCALFFHFRGGRMGWLTFLPIVTEVLGVCGIMAALGLPIHFYSVLAMPLVLCLAMDNALQLSQYYIDRQPCTVRQAMHSVARVVALSCSLIALIYGSLSLVSYSGIRDFGLTVLAATFVIPIVSLLFLPALLKLLGRGQPIIEAMTVEGSIEV